MPYSTGLGDGVQIYTKDKSGLALSATIDGQTPPETADIFAKGCEVTALVTGVKYVNVGSSASPSWEIK